MSSNHETSFFRKSSLSLFAAGASLMALGPALTAGDITVRRDQNTLVITGRDSNDAMGVWFNSVPNQPQRLFVRVANSTGKVNLSGGTNGGAENFDLAGITKIRVSVAGGLDSVQFLQGTKDKKNWNGDLDLDFGTIPSTTKNHETLVIRGPMVLRNVVVRGNHARRNDTIEPSVTIQSFQRL